MKIQNASSSHFIPTPFIHRAGCALLIGGLMMTGAFQTHAEQLKTPVMKQGADRTAVQMPRHGQTQQQVRASFGQPQGVKGPVGEPPITQWFYEEFVVYFEYDHVIHAVVKPESR